MPGLTKKKKIRRVLKQVADPEVADVLTTTEEFDEDEQTPIQFANAGLLGDVQRSSVGEGYLSPESLLQQQQDIALQTEGPLAQVQSQNLNPALYPTDPSLGLAEQDYAAGLPEEDVTFRGIMDEGVPFDPEDALASLGDPGLNYDNVVVFTDSDGTEVTMGDLLMVLPAARVANVLRTGGSFLSKIYKAIAKRNRARKAAKKGSEYTGGRTKTETGTTTSPAGIVSPKATTTRTGPSATTPGPNVTPGGSLIKAAVPTAIAAGGFGGGLGVPWWLERGAKGGAEFVGDLVEKYGPGIKDTFEWATMTDEEKLAEEAYARQSQARDVELQFATKEEDIVDEAAGLLSPSGGVDPGIGPGGEPQSITDILQRRDAFVNEKEIQDVVDTGLNPERIYADFSQDIAGKRNRYLAALNEMYKKVAILNVIASLTNSPSQATAFMKLASDKFQALEGFDDEERYQKIAQGVFFREDGSFDAPKSKEEAFNRAIQFGATHDEAIKLSGHKAEPKTTTSGSYKTWHNPTTKQSVVMAPGQAPRGADGQVLEGWFPGELDSDEGGTAGERNKIETMKILQDGDISAAINNMYYYLMGRESIYAMDPEVAWTTAVNMVKALMDPSSPARQMSDDELIDLATKGTTPTASNIQRAS